VPVCLALFLLVYFRLAFCMTRERSLHLTTTSKGGSTNLKTKEEQQSVPATPTFSTISP